MTRLQWKSYTQNDDVSGEVLTWTIHLHNKLYIDDYDWLRNDQGRLSTNENRSNIAICNHDRTKDFSNLDFICFYCQNKGIYDQLLDVKCIQW